MSVELLSLIDAAAEATSARQRLIDQIRNALPDVPAELWQAFDEAAEEEVRCLEPLRELARANGGNMPIGH